MIHNSQNLCLIFYLKIHIGDGNKTRILQKEKVIINSLMMSVIYFIKEAVLYQLNPIIYVRFSSINKMNYGFEEG